MSAETNTRAFAEDVAYYLTLTPRQLPSQYLYDELGSSLFESICRLPWYPITRRNSSSSWSTGAPFSIGSRRCRRSSNLDREVVKNCDPVGATVGGEPHRPSRGYFRRGARQSHACGGGLLRAADRCASGDLRGRAVGNELERFGRTSARDVPRIEYRELRSTGRRCVFTRRSPGRGIRRWVALGTDLVKPESGSAWPTMIRWASPPRSIEICSCA